MLSARHSVALIAVFAVAAFAAPAQAGPADPDFTFGGDGYIQDHFATSSMGWEQVLPMSSGSIFAVGGTSVVTATDPDLAGSGGNDFVVAKFNEDGSSDTGFGTGGFSLADFDGNPNNAWAIGVQGSGKIIAAGTAGGGGGATAQMGAVRFDSTGAIDSSFGNATPTPNGRTKLTVGTNNAYARSLDVGSDNTIGLGVQANDNTGGVYAYDEFSAVKLTDSGLPEPGFGLFIPGPDRNGIRMITMQASSFSKTATAHMLSDGSFLIGGQVSAGFGDMHMGLAKLEPDSDLDPTFGDSPGAGKTISPEFNEWGERVNKSVVQSDGKIVLVGGTDDMTQTDVHVARFNADGTPDATFGGGDGFIQQAIGISNDSATAVDIHSDGRIVVAGTTQSGTDDLLFAARFMPDGTLDPTFGAGGIQSLSIATVGLGNGVDSVAVDDDQRILISGIYEKTGGGMGPFILRLEGGLPAIPGANPPVEPPVVAALITGPDDDGKHSKRKLLKLAGTASSTGSPVAKVEIALLREIKGKCYWLKSSKVKYRKSRKGSNPCSKSTWLKASGTTNWSFKFKRKLPRGTYRAYARVTLADGSVHEAFTSGKNAIKFKVR